MSKSSCKTIELEAYPLDKDRALPKEMLKSLTERLRGPLRLSGVDSIVTQSSSHQEGPTHPYGEMLLVGSLEVDTPSPVHK